MDIALRNNNVLAITKLKSKNAKSSLEIALKYAQYSLIEKLLKRGDVIHEAVYIEAKNLGEDHPCYQLLVKPYKDLKAQIIDYGSIKSLEKQETFDPVQSILAHTYCTDEKIRNEIKEGLVTLYKKNDSILFPLFLAATAIVQAKRPLKIIIYSDKNNVNAPYYNPFIERVGFFKNTKNSIYIAYKSNIKNMLATIIHELAHAADEILYQNETGSFYQNDYFLAAFKEIQSYDQNMEEMFSALSVIRNESYYKKEHHYDEFSARFREEFADAYLHNNNAKLTQLKEKFPLSCHYYGNIYLVQVEKILKATKQTEGIRVMGLK